MTAAGKGKKDQKDAHGRSIVHVTSGGRTSAIVPSIQKVIKAGGKAGGQAGGKAGGQAGGKAGGQAGGKAGGQAGGNAKRQAAKPAEKEHSESDDEEEEEEEPKKKPRKKPEAAPKQRTVKVGPLIPSPSTRSPIRCDCHATWISAGSSPCGR